MLGTVLRPRVARANETGPVPPFVKLLSIRRQQILDKTSTYGIMPEGKD